MKHRLLVLWVFGLASCASFVGEYEERFVRSLPNQRDVTLSEQKTYPGDILCGRYTAPTVQGFSVRSGDFVVGADFVLTRPRAIDVAVLCSRDPEGALLQQSGIGAPGGDWTALVKIRDDMQALDRALLNYYNRRHALPGVLNDLLADDYGIAAGSLIDPWGQPYTYRAGLSGRSAPQYTLVSLGNDGVSGGVGLAADVAHEQSRLLDHVIQVGGY